MQCRGCKTTNLLIPNTYSGAARTTFNDRRFIFYRSGPDFPLFYLHSLWRIYSQYQRFHITWESQVETQTKVPRLMSCFESVTPPGEETPLTKWDAIQIWHAHCKLTTSTTKNTFYIKIFINSLNLVMRLTWLDWECWWPAHRAHIISQSWSALERGNLFFTTWTR